MPVRVAALDQLQLREVAAFLHATVDRRASVELWSASLVVPWTVDAPNAGFALRQDDAIVGAQLAFYAERVVGGQHVRFCNLGPFSVLPGYRAHSLRLVAAVLAQEGYHFTDLTPSRQVAAINERFGFEFLDTTMAVLVNAPSRSRGRITADRDAIEGSLSGRDLQLYRDHADAKGARHVLLADGAERCYVMFRTFRRRRVRLAQVLYVGNPELYAHTAHALGGHLLVHHGAFATVTEDRVVSRRPRRAFTLPTRPLKMYKSESVPPAQIDDLYSELVCLPW